MKKTDEIIKDLGLIILIATIIIFNLIIGANEKGLRILPISVLMGLNLIYLIIVKIKYKQKIFFKNKIDYLVLLFMLTTTLPLIFKTYASYSDTVEFIMKYVYIYSLYLVARNVIKDKKSVEIIINATLICSVIQVIISLCHNFSIFEKFIQWLNLTYNQDTTFHGTFGYANAQAIYMAFCILLGIHKFKIHGNKILKTLDILYVLFALFILLITEARAVMGILGIILLVLFIKKYKEHIIRHKKKILISLGSVVFIIETFLIISLNTSKPIIKNNESLDRMIIYSCEKDKEYTLELNMVTELTENSKGTNNRTFDIELMQCGPYFQESTIAKATSGLVNGYYSISFTPTEDTKYIRLKIKNKFHGKITINDFYINGKRVIVDYKYLPNNIGNLLSKFNIADRSIPQRYYMYRDCLKITADSPIIGNGGNAWKAVSRSVSDYNSSLKESHSYFFELLISYGIIGLLAFLSMVIYFFIKIFKQCKDNKNIRKDKLLIALGLFMVVLHCMVDFDMSFMLIQLLVYIYMAVLLFDEQEDEMVQEKNGKFTKAKIKDYVVILFLVFILSLYIRADISEYLLKDSSDKYDVTPYKNTYYYEKIKQEISNRNYSIDLLDEINDFMDKEKYHYTSSSNYLAYFKAITKNAEVLSNEELKKYFSIGINRLETVRLRTTYDFDDITERIQMLAIVTNELQKFKINNDDKMQIIQNSVQELKQIAQKEYEVDIKKIEDFERTGLEESTKQKYLKKIENAMDLIR